MQQIASSERPVIFYESTHRILKALSELDTVVPAGKIHLARELTKMYEEIISGTPKELSDLLTENPKKTKGEFVVIVENR
jgi:16S rRNA (cytidine1402-2'-O)-methyltransferase